MREQILGFHASFLVHGIIIGTVFFLSQGVFFEKRSAHIDLSLLTCTSFGGGDNGSGRGPLDSNLDENSPKSKCITDAPRQPEKTASQSPHTEKAFDSSPKTIKNPARDQTVPKEPVVKTIPEKIPHAVVPALPKQNTKREKPNPLEPSEKEKAIPSAEKCKNLPDAEIAGPEDVDTKSNIAEARSGPAEPLGDRIATSTGRIGKQGKGVDGSGQWHPGGGENAYLSHIRDRLRNHLSYPQIARHKGWAGKVLVAFTVFPDGSADELKIKESCGIALLDRCALETIRNACPFPKPPVAARIVLPIVYHLNGHDG